MSATKQLPEGLQLAAKLLYGDRDAFICGQVNPVSGLTPNDEVIAAGYLAAIDAIREEHAQRVTLQHHCADQAQRIADLEAKCITLKELHDAAADERDALRARLAEIDAQEPAAWRIKIEELCFHGKSADALLQAVSSMTLHAVPAPEPLFERPVTARAVPDGWRLVPVEPTREMFRAATVVDDAAYVDGSQHGADVATLWEAMIAAAPEHKA